MSKTIRLDGLSFPMRSVSLAGFAAKYSEPESGAPAENLVSNEDSYTRVVSDLSRRASRGGVFLGVGPEQNFSLIAASSPGLAILMDYRRRNALLHLVHKALFTLSSDRWGYLSRLIARGPERKPTDEASPKSLVAAFREAPFDRQRLGREIREVRRYLLPLGLVAEGEWETISTIQARLAGAGMEARFLGLPGYPTMGRMIVTTRGGNEPAHFLGSEASYQVVRELQLTDRIVPLVGDFAGAGAMGRLRAGLREMGLALSVVYISDVEFFLFRSGKFNEYIRNLAAFPRLDTAVIVRTSTRPIENRERVSGDQCTTVVRDLAQFLKAAEAGHVRSADDLFRG
ncbi:MAG: hypothetical protein JWN86_2771 [Planctomycetota bacterium]|nr:hypothetical protein [Planctomycetota bacterium]